MTVDAQTVKIVQLRGETRALIGGGGGGKYSYLLEFIIDEFLLKSAVIKVDFKRTVGQNTNI